jgi:hypothetical protein
MIERKVKWWTVSYQVQRGGRWKTTLISAPSPARALIHWIERRASLRADHPDAFFEVYDRKVHPDFR